MRQNFSSSFLNFEISTMPKINPQQQQPISMSSDKKSLITHFIRGTKLSPQEFQAFGRQLYEGLHYSTSKLKGPSNSYLQKMTIQLPEDTCSSRKFLLLDLDQTLIHSVPSHETAQVSLKLGSKEIHFNVRPHCLQFLGEMSQLYDIYIFTAAEKHYAATIVKYLNHPRKVIRGILSRNHCMQTSNGLYIKDLRVIKNRSLKEMALVDNFVHSFGLQLTNGVPILPYTNKLQDCELIGLKSVLAQMAEVSDVRTFLEEKIGLGKLLQCPKEQSINRAIN